MQRKPKSGRKRKTNEHQERLLVREIKKDPNKTAIDLQDHAKSKLGLDFSRWTAQRILNRHNLKAYRPAHTALLKECHRRARLLFACKYRHWTTEQWGKVIWSDESKFNMHNSDRGNTVRRPPGKRYDQRYVKTQVKFHGGGIMTWGL